MTSKEIAVKKGAKRRSRQGSERATMASQADRHRLYEDSVQNTDTEYDFINDTFRALRGRVPVTLREDFCGTAAMCCEWVRRRNKNVAVGVDLDREVLRWGEDNNLATLSRGQRKRVTLLRENVLSVKTNPVDVVVAMNFSYYIFKERKLLRRYFRHVRDGLVDDGVLMMDAFGGYEAFRELREKTEYDDFTYVWDQHYYDPITGNIICHIDFQFPDGSKLRRAFTYDWRMWTLPELQEILLEAGFRNVTVYWQGTDEETGEGNDEFLPAIHGEADAGWICFLAAEK